MMNASNANLNLNAIPNQNGNLVQSLTQKNSLTNIFKTEIKETVLRRTNRDLTKSVKTVVNLAALKKAGVNFNKTKSTEDISLINSPNLSRKEVSVIIKKYRIKDYKVDTNPEWYEKNGFPIQKFNKEVINDIDYQSSLIIDEIKVLLDNIQHYKISQLQDREVIIIYKLTYIVS